MQNSFFAKKIYLKLTALLEYLEVMLQNFYARNSYNFCIRNFFTKRFMVACKTAFNEKRADVCKRNLYSSG